MVPASHVGDVECVVDAVRARQQGRLAIEMTADPELLEPADVAHLPDRRLDEVRLTPQHLRLGQALEQLELDAPGVAQALNEIGSAKPHGTGLPSGSVGCPVFGHRHTLWHYGTRYRRASRAATCRCGARSS